MVRFKTFVTGVLLVLSAMAVGVASAAQPFWITKLFIVLTALIGTAHISLLAEDLTKRR